MVRCSSGMQKWKDNSYSQIGRMLKKPLLPLACSGTCCSRCSFVIDQYTRQLYEAPTAKRSMNSAAILRADHCAELWDRQLSAVGMTHNVNCKRPTILRRLPIPRRPNATSGSVTKSGGLNLGTELRDSESVSSHAGNSHIHEAVGGK